MKRILVVEDNALLNRTLTFNLISDGYEVVSASTCASARSALSKGFFHMALLDINLPDGSGLTLCGEMKDQYRETYVIFLTANDRESDQLRGYEAGGADYVTKPFSLPVLCKKIGAVFQSMEREEPRRDRFDDGFLKIDFSEQAASKGGIPVEFTPKEYRALFLFVKNPHLILTKRQLLEKLWDVDGEFVDEHTLTTIISRIRKKLETPERGYIKTVYGVGYQWMGGART